MVKDGAMYTMPAFDLDVVHLIVTYLIISMSLILHFVHVIEIAQKPHTTF